MSESRPQIKLTPEMVSEIRGAWAEIDREQMAIISRLTPAERVRLGLDLSETVFEVAIYRLRQLRPELSKMEARRLVYEEHYRRNPSTCVPR